ncbi:MAG: hypothetical protein R2751_03375 [Bacteroidales bacterium]
MPAYPHHLTPKEIRFSESLCEGHYLIGFRRDFDFQAGQVLGLALEESGPRRLYSICSGERDPDIQLLYKVVEDGYLTPRLPLLEAGDRVWVTGVRGEFICREEDAVWIATGTGIAPFYAMLRSGQGPGKTLIHGNRYLEEFHFFEEFRDVLGDNYIRCCTGEESGDVFPGRVTDYLREVPGLDPRRKYYLCGSAEMVVDVRDLLIERGVPFGHILSEIYF